MHSFIPPCIHPHRELGKREYRVWSVALVGLSASLADVILAYPMIWGSAPSVVVRITECKTRVGRLCTWVVVCCAPPLCGELVFVYGMDTLKFYYYLFGVKRLFLVDCFYLLFTYAVIVNRHVLSAVFRRGTYTFGFI